MEKIILETVPVNPDATDEAGELLHYLAECSGTCILTGQHTQTNPMEERAYIKEVTGCYPKVVGFEMLSYSGNINWEDASEACLTEVKENQNTMETALKLAKTQDIIVTICFHWFSPIGGRDKAFYTEHTDIDAERVLISGTPEEKAFYRDLESIGKELRVFQDAHIPVLWRPFHEVEGTWFWWGAKGGRVAAELYRKMYRYFVDELKLNHLLWVWSSPTKEAFPGDEFVDVIGWDIYLPEKEATDYKKQYEELTANTTKHKVAALTEVGYNPDVAMLSESHVPWAYYMTWSKEFILEENYNTKEELRGLYDNPYSVKL
ncbi:MAG: beta-mannosidase [Lachnospiraceae bacterium]|nr:beta-mannosidase [Lachnospiraceae bacterium]